MALVNERNRRIVEEFRANAGMVGGHFEGASLLILHTTGRRTGREHVTPLVYLPDGERYVVFGSKGGAPTHPEWFLNLTTNPDATVEVGARTIRVRATEVTGPERDELYARQVERWEVFRDYPSKTSRVIPAVALDPV
ncbi:MAG TPA: nitroreductase/quinone reductase family protein [Actinomycetota bacterium]|nr:nitroreductase/quinone reductase family protein [Actinomycetota bacterium]